MTIRRLTLSLGAALEGALCEAPRRLGLASSSSLAERLRTYAMLGYERLLEDELEAKRLETYRRWADDPDIGRAARAASRRAARRGAFEE